MKGFYEYGLALKMWENFKEIVTKDEYYAASITWAYYSVHALLDNKLSMNDVRVKICETIFDKKVEARVLLWASLEFDNDLYSAKVSTWPPFHTNPKLFNKLLAKKGEEGRRDVFTLDNIIYVGSL